MSLGCEKTVLACSARLRFRSFFTVAEAGDGAGDGVLSTGAMAVRLFESLLEEEVRLDLKALIWLSRYDMVGRWMAHKQALAGRLHGRLRY